MSPPASVGTGSTGVTGPQGPTPGARTVLRLRSPTLDLAPTRPCSSTGRTLSGLCSTTRVPGFARAVLGKLAALGAVGALACTASPWRRVAAGWFPVPGDPVEVVPCVTGVLRRRHRRQPPRDRGPPSISLPSWSRSPRVQCAPRSCRRPSGEPAGPEPPRSRAGVTSGVRAAPAASLARHDGGCQYPADGG